MTEPKHTPGPWVVTTDLRVDDEIICDMLNEKGYVAITKGQKLAHWRDDAKLIAASPDLLAAAQKTVDAWAKFIDSFNYVPGIGDRAEDMEFKELAELRAAIAKATQ